MSERLDSVWDLLVARIAALEAIVVRLNDDACERTKELEAKVSALEDRLDSAYSDIGAALDEDDPDGWIGGNDGPDD